MALRSGTNACIVVVLYFFSNEIIQRRYKKTRDGPRHFIKTSARYHKNNFIKIIFDRCFKLINSD